jgi:hypothetical protein
MAIVGKSAPWVTYYNELKALFGQDPDIKMCMEESVTPPSQVITLTVKKEKKATALSSLLPQEKTFGNVKVYIRVESEENKRTNKNLLNDAFENNPVVTRIITTSYDPLAPTPVPPMTYVEFANKVVQFFDDRLDDPRGNMSTLYQNIAKDVLRQNDGVTFCTAAPEKLVSSIPVKKPDTKNKKTDDELSKLIDDVMKSLKL